MTRCSMATLLRHGGGAFLLWAALSGPCLAQDKTDKARDKAQADQDVVFKALSDELARAQGLFMEKMDKPYYLQANSNEIERFSVSASFGAITQKGGGVNRSLSTKIRVGTPDLDNTNFSGGGSSFGFRRGRGGFDPQEADYDAFRQRLWKLFDSDYKSAVETISKKRAFLETNNVEDRQPDFGEAPVEDLILPRGTLKMDKARWTQVVKRVSAVFRNYPYVYQGTASFRGRLSHQYFVSTDPARHLFSKQSVGFRIQAQTQAEDGMLVSADYRVDARTEAGLPQEKELIAAAKQVAEELKQRMEADKAENYMGPVLFVGEAAGTLFLRTVGDTLSNPRQRLGGSSSQRGRLIDRLGKRIATKLLSVRDDPTQKTWNGRPLFGYYPIDDDGVKPQPIDLISRGVLQTYFMSRVPTRHLKETNGHSRAGKGSVGNLFVKATETTTLEELTQQLLELASEEGLDYGILVESFTSSRGLGGESGSISLPSPRKIYKVYEDGRKVPIRGGSFKKTSYRILKDLVAIGDDPYLLNTTQRGQQVSVVAPSVLVESLELREPKKEFTKPPVLPRPELD